MGIGQLQPECNGLLSAFVTSQEQLVTCDFTLNAAVTHLRRILLLEQGPKQMFTAYCL